MVALDLWGKDLKSQFVMFDTMTKRNRHICCSDTPTEDEAGNKLKVYTCGPTIYDFAHIGNMRTYVVEDILMRTLRMIGFEVFHVMNITDVDDKTIRKACELGITLKEHVQQYEDAFFEDLASIGNNFADEYPRATEYIDQMNDIIQRLLDKGLAYIGADGSVYYKISAFDSYGQLAGISFCGSDCATSNKDEYTDEEVCDFVLWKAWDESRDGNMWWDSPFGKGRPGWHIECSAMAMSLMGDTLDIHAGGVDNMFPHHENEIAQSEGVSGKTFVKHWMHVEHLLVDGAKMSKSKGNFYTVRGLLDMGWSGAEIRLSLLKAHYKVNLNFTLDSLEESRKNLNKIKDAYSFVMSLKLTENLEETNEDRRNTSMSFLENFLGFMLNDLNVPGALGVLFDFVHFTNSMETEISLDSKQTLLSIYDTMFDFLGLSSCAVSFMSDQRIVDLLEKRQVAKALRNWDLSDRLRHELKMLGVAVQDKGGLQHCVALKKQA